MSSEHHFDVTMMQKIIILLAIVAAVTESMGRTTVDLPEELHEKLKERAAKNNRSVTAEMVTILQRCVEWEEISVPPRKEK